MRALLTLLMVLTAFAYVSAVETVGFRIALRSRSLVFIPDSDKWEKWPVKPSDLLASTDHLLLDGTFFADVEISRPMSEVPHPFVTETMHLLRDLPPRERANVHFIHFNHSNPLVQGDSRAIRQVKSADFCIAARGQRFSLE